MDIEKFSLLESKISQLIERLAALKTEKRQLEERVRSLESLKEENKALHEGQSAARSSLEAILKKLEGIDFS